MVDAKKPIEHCPNLTRGVEMAIAALKAAGNFNGLRIVRAECDTEKKKIEDAAFDERPEEWTKDWIENHANFTLEIDIESRSMCSGPYVNSEFDWNQVDKDLKEFFSFYIGTDVVYTYGDINIEGMDTEITRSEGTLSGQISEAVEAMQESESVADSEENSRPGQSKLVYYAHSIALYGSEQEKRDIATLEQMGFEVLNPNAPEHDKGYLREGMPYFDRLVDSCDGLYFRANPDGSIPAGVARERMRATNISIPVFEFPSNVLRRTLSVDQTRMHLREQGAR